MFSLEIMDKIKDIDMSVFLYVCLSVCCLLSDSLSHCLTVSLSVCLSACLSHCLSVSLSTCSAVILQPSLSWSSWFAGPAWADGISGIEGEALRSWAVIQERY